MRQTVSKHLFHIVKKQFVTPDTVAKFLQQKNGTDYIGALPGEIITRIPKNKRAKTTKQVNDILSEFANQIARIAHFDNLDTINRENATTEFEYLEKQLARILGLKNITVKSIGHGTYKFCFSLDFGISNNLYTLQTFKDFCGNKLSNCAIKHGALFEPQNYFLVYNRYSHGRVARPFMSKPVSKTTSTHAYILTKYIDNNHISMPLLGPFISGRQYMISDDFNAVNKINGIIVDAGNYSITPGHIANKEIYLQWQCFAQILDRMDFFSRSSYRISQHLLNTYNKIGNDFFDTNLWPQIIQNLNHDDKIAAKKMLRLLRRLKIKKEELGDKYENVRKLLNQDFINIFDFTLVNQEMSLYERGNEIKFYPELVCKILGVNNVPPLRKIASEYVHTKPMIIYNQNTRVHWDKYYSIDEVYKCAKEFPYGIDWDDVIRDFNLPTIISYCVQQLFTR